MDDERLRACTAKIVASYLSRNPTAANQVPGIIASVYGALSAAKPPAIDAPREPAISIRHSIRPDALICLDCGFKTKILKRHLHSAHDLSPDEYRKRWNLPFDYPMTAPSYALQRSALAKEIGLGRKKVEPPPPIPQRRRGGGRRARQVESASM